MVYRFIEVKELTDHGAVADMFGYGAETVILGNAANIVFTVVLAQGLVVPTRMNSSFATLPSDGGLWLSCCLLADIIKWF